MKEITEKKETDHYNSGYHGRIHSHLIANDEYFYARAESSANLYFTQEERSGKVFEYGCGIGQGIAVLPNAAGWDVSAEALASCRARGIQVYDELDQVPRNTWPVVMCRHVLEHVEAPLESLRVMRELLTARGKLILIVPKESHYRCSMDADDHQHLFAWNFRSINNLLIRAGFQVTRNQVQYVLGYRSNLPIRRFFGSSVYSLSTRILGRVLLNGELVIWATRSR
jgi:SAM-dependent methyltransferase